MMFEKGDALRWLYGRLFGHPMNFSFIDDLVAGCAGPQRKREIDWMRKEKGIGAILSLRETPLAAGWVEGLEYLNVPVLNHSSPSLHQLKECVEFLVLETSSGRRTAVHCFLPSTFVGSLCPTDITQISGDVIGSDGLLHGIVRKFQHHYRGPVVRVSALGILPVTCTPNHNFLVSRPRRNLASISPERDLVREDHYHYGKILGCAGQPSWIKAKDIGVGDFLLSPIVKFSPSATKPKLDMKSECGNSYNIKVPEVSSDLAWLFGVYAVHGSSVDQDTIQFELWKKDDVERATMVISSLGAEASLKEFEDLSRLTVNSRTLAYNFRRWFGTNHLEIHLPNLVFGWDTASVLEGVTDGMGYGSPRKSCAFSSMSPTLTQQVWLLSLANGRYPHIRTYERVEGKNAPPLWVVGWKEEESRSTTAKWSSYYRLPVTSIGHSIYDGPVYNLEVSEDQTYLANGVIVHNCAAGLGRTGTILAAYLCFREGLRADEAIRQIRAKRHGSIERLQEQVIHEYCDAVKGGNASKL